MMGEVAQKPPQLAVSGLRIGLAFPGDVRIRTTWSGTPSGVFRALSELGVSVEPLAAELPRPLSFVATNALALGRLHRTPGPTLKERFRTSRTIVLFTGREMAALRSWAISRQLRRVEPLSAVIQIGTGYDIPSGCQVATFEDMTVHQALQFAYPEWQGLSKVEQQARLDKQRNAYVNADACCFTSTWAAESAIRDSGIAPDKVHVVGVGRNHAPRPVTRDWDTPRFLFVGAEWRRKNGETVIRAFQRVRRSVPNACLDLVGDHPELELPGVTCHGRLSLGDEVERAKLHTLFETATCFVMPSLYEPSAIAYVEAAAAGIPSIGTNIGGSAELIGQGGRAINPLDEDELVAAMEELADPHTAQDLGSKALQRADYYTWPAVASRILKSLAL